MAKATKEAKIIDAEPVNGTVARPAARQKTRAHCPAAGRVLRWFSAGWRC